ncbi:MAG: hypothetical protein H5T62_10140 [Anaerolineae bacterium]|nr:hypothetical protein [Anaerolineae bacterium]
MARAEIVSGICGFTTVVEASMNGRSCQLTITSQCQFIQRLAEELTQVNPLEEISFRRSMPRTYQAAVKHCAHAACPVPAGIIKVVEVEAGLALPADVHIKLSGRSTAQEGESEKAR